MQAAAAAAVAVLHALAPVESVLLIRRASNPRDPWSGHWSFPGGRCDPDDQDLLATALRELHEECGIRLAREALTRALPMSMAGGVLRVAPFVFQVETELATTLAEREAESALWVPMAFLRDPSRHRWQPIPGHAAQQPFPAIELAGMPLWGFTYRVLCDWLGVDPPPLA